MQRSEDFKDLLDCPAHRLGAALRLHRETIQISHAEISRRMDYSFTPVVLQMIEHGRYPLEPGQILLLMFGYDADPDLLLPLRNELTIDPGRNEMAVGPTIRELNQSSTAEDLLYDYLSLLYTVRDAEPGSTIPLRDEDLAILAETAREPIEVIRAALVDLMSSWNQPRPSQAPRGG